MAEFRIEEFGSENEFCDSCFPLITKFENDPRVEINWDEVYNGFR